MVCASREGCLYNVLVVGELLTVAALQGRLMRTEVIRHQRPKTAIQSGHYIAFSSHFKTGDPVISIVQGNCMGTDILKSEACWNKSCCQH